MRRQLLRRVRNRLAHPINAPQEADQRWMRHQHHAPVLGQRRGKSGIDDVVAQSPLRAQEDGRVWPTKDRRRGMERRRAEHTEHPTGAHEVHAMPQVAVPEFVPPQVEGHTRVVGWLVAQDTLRPVRVPLNRQLEGHIQRVQVRHQTGQAQGTGSRWWAAPSGSLHPRSHHLIPASPCPSPSGHMEATDP